MKSTRRKSIYLPNPRLAAALLESADPKEAERMRTEYSDKLFAARVKRLEELFGELGVDLPPDNPWRWQVLAFRLALKYDPGFRVTHKRVGRPAKARLPKKAKGRPPVDRSVDEHVFRQVEAIRDTTPKGRRRMSRKEAIKKWVIRETNEGRLQAARNNKPEVRYRQIKTMLDHYARTVAKNPNK